MSDALESGCRDRALGVLRGYVDGDAKGVEGALAGLDERGWVEVYAVLSGLLNTTVGIMELAGGRQPSERIARSADEVASVAPPHYEFAVSEATRAWARGDRTALRAMSERDVPGAVHLTAVFVTVFGVAVWGRTGFLDVLRAFQEAGTDLPGDRPSGV